MLVGCHSTVTRRSTLLTTGPQLSINLLLRRQSAASLSSYVPWFFHSFNQYSTKPTFTAPRLCARPLRCQVIYPILAFI